MPGPLRCGWSSPTRSAQRRPMQREIVVDHVDAQPFGIAPTDVLVEGQHLARALGQAVAAEQHVGVNVIRAEEVADSAAAHIRRPSAPGTLALGVAVARVGLQRDWPELVEA